MEPLERISGYGHVALRYGLEEAIFLDSIVYWYRENRANNRNFEDGRWWTYNTISAFQELFPYWSAKQIRRIANSCRDQGALLVGNYSEDQRDRTIWYTPGDDLLALYGLLEDAETDNCICPNGQMQLSKRADSFAQTGKCNKETCNTHDIPPIVPQGDDALFNRFWAAYPKRKGKEAARRAWRKLQPDMALCRVMAKALDRQKRSAEWTEAGGKYIPYPATWLNGRRWEDEVDPPPDAAFEEEEGVTYI